MTGERLGTVDGGGSSSSSSSQSQPQPQPQPPTQFTPSPAQPHPATTTPAWKLELLAAPSISVRRGVARSYGAAYEDTSTLVLTSAGRWFVDVRFALGDAPTAAGSSFWAFAGTSAVTFPGEGMKGERRRGRGGGWREGGETVEVPCMGHCVWRHEMDSKGVDGGEADEGDLYLLGNGQVVEVGVSGSGESGRVEMYKEYWEGVEVGEGGDGRCVVARTEGGEMGMGMGMGMVIRVGKHCQGMFQRVSSGAGAEEEAGTAGEVCVERWYRSGESGVWAKDWRSSSTMGKDDAQEVGVMPSKWVCEEGRKVGDVVEVQGRKWEVVECA